MLSSTTITPDDRGAILQQDANNKQDNLKNQLKKQTLLFGVRHGVSVANEYMSQPGHRWGDVTFYDDVQYTDAPLSVAGQQQVGRLAASLGKTLLQSLLLEQQLPPFVQERKKQEQAEQCSDESDSVDPTANNIAGTAAAAAAAAAAAVPVELVVVSPLTRCLETWLYGVRPALSALSLSTSASAAASATAQTVPCIVLPLATERVYTSSDTGGRLSLQELQSVFSQPELDWSYMPTTTTSTSTSTPTTTSTATTTTATNSDADDSPPWWYTGTAKDKRNNPSQQQLELEQQQLEQQQQQNDSLKEWRPHGQGQYYACPGEPQDVFEQRMRQLVEWLRQRPERCIVLVTHWGVLHYLAANEPDVENCGLVRIDIDIE
jgi:broad specificity phosphatase PhoE